MQATLGELAALVEGRLVGDENILIQGAASLRDAEPGQEVKAVQYAPLNWTINLTALATFVLGVIPTSALALVQLAAKLLMGT